MNAFLSNFHDAPILLDGIWYPTSEHAYQASKFNATSSRKYIAGLSTPGKAKRAGAGDGIPEDMLADKLDLEEWLQVARQVNGKSCKD